MLKNAAKLRKNLCVNKKKYIFAAFFVHYYAHFCANRWTKTTISLSENVAYKLLTDA